jgi:hypothetical protein
MPLRYQPSARRDRTNVLKWSAENFGQAAAARYKKLLGVALSEIAANPTLEGSSEVLACRTESDSTTCDTADPGLPSTVSSSKIRGISWPTSFGNRIR